MPDIVQVVLPLGDVPRGSQVRLLKGERTYYVVDVLTVYHGKTQKGKRKVYPDRRNKQRPYSQIFPDKGHRYLMAGTYVTQDLKSSEVVWLARPEEIREFLSEFV